jgi:hypothetical protein
MTNEESNEAKLLRLLIGYVHVMAVNNLAALRYQKVFVELTEDQKNSLNQEVTTGATRVAEQTGGALATPMGGIPPVLN